MTNFSKKAFSVIATIGLMAQLTVPAFADTTLVVAGNGANSNSAVNVANNNNATVTQQNTAVVSNNVNTSSTTGGNTASQNTGGNNAILTGNAHSDANVNTSVNLNHATVDPSCNCNEDTKVKILGNGFDSTNNANLENTTNANLNQKNSAVVVNNVDASAKTGANDASKNTGGTSEILTGDAHANANVQTNANANVAQIGGGNGNRNGGSTLLVEDGNGADSNNKIELKNETAAQIVQENNAVVTNNVDSDASTGKNTASQNTGGTVKVFTGNADASANVDTNANFNAADVINCSCNDAVFADVNGNGFQSKNNIKAGFANDVKLWQGAEEGQVAVLANDVNADAKTGDNAGVQNTGATSFPDPVAIFTGDSSTNTDVMNNANANVFGTVPQITWPNFDLGGQNDNNVGFTFDFNFFGQSSNG